MLFEFTEGLQGEVSPADWAVDRLYAPGIDTAGVEDVVAAHFPDVVSRHDDTETDRAKRLIFHNSLCNAGGHEVIEMTDVMAQRYFHDRRTSCSASAEEGARDQSSHEGHTDEHY